MEEIKIDRDEKYFHIENIGKNIVTTVIGIVLMGASAGTFIMSWFVELPLIKDKTWQIAAVFFLGFILLFMRDKLSTYIDMFSRKKIDTIK